MDATQQLQDDILKAVGKYRSTQLSERVKRGLELRRIQSQQARATLKEHWEELFEEIVVRDSFTQKEMIEVIKSLQEQYEGVEGGKR